jgi:hypothetical protein
MAENSRENIPYCKSSSERAWEDPEEATRFGMYGEYRIGNYKITIKGLRADNWTVFNAETNKRLLDIYFYPLKYIGKRKCRRKGRTFLLLSIFVVWYD